MIAKLILLSEMEDDGLTDPSGTVITPSGRNLLVAVRGNLSRAGAKVGEIEVVDGKPRFPWSMDGVAYLLRLDKDDAVRLELDAKPTFFQKLFRGKTAAAQKRAIDTLVKAVNDHDLLDVVQETRL